MCRIARLLGVDALGGMGVVLGRREARRQRDASEGARAPAQLGRRGRAPLRQRLQPVGLHRQFVEVREQLLLLRRQGDAAARRRLVEVHRHDRWVHLGPV